MRKATTFALVLSVLSAFSASPVFADNYPSRIMTLLVPFAAGSATDTVARYLAAGLTQRFKQPVIVENKPGANGIVGSRALVSGAADGYTIFVTTNSTHAANANLYKNLPYDPIKDFAPVARLAEVALAIVVRPDLPVENLNDLLKLAKSKELSYASGNTSALVGAELVARAAGNSMLRVSYTANTQAIMDVIQSRVDVMAADMTIALPQIEAKKVKPIAVTSATRIKQIPDVPSVVEAGHPDLELIGFWAAFVKAGTPPEIVSKLNAALVDIVNSKECEDFLAQNGARPYPSTPEELGRFVENQTAKWATFVETGRIEKQ